MPINNIFELGELFELVQQKKIFADGKTFVDCIPKAEFSYILHRYETEKNNPAFDLADFVHQYFNEPERVAVNYISDANEPLKDHLKKLWPVLTHHPQKKVNDSLIPLPKDYIVPGGRFREIYYWDSFFTMLGLQVSQQADLIENMVDNFSYLIDRIGYIPNGNRTYYVGRSQPPFFACMVQLLSEEKGKNILVKYLPQLEKEYHFWMKGSDQLNKKNISVNRVVRMPDGSMLNHYWDENDTPRPESFREDVELATKQNDKKKMYRHLRAAAESGWDFSSRWFEDENSLATIHTTDIIPVDLNCLLFNLENAIAAAYQIKGEEDRHQHYLTVLAIRKDAINKYCWSDSDHFYYDYDFIRQSPTASESLAAAFPLYFKIASQLQAQGTAEKIKRSFFKNGGLITTTTQTSQQWDAPNGWAPLQWMAIIGLKNYGFGELAKDIALRWLALNEKVYRNTGKMMEKYNVVDTNLLAGGGEYDAQDGFGWTNGVFLALKKMFAVNFE